jgi:putative OPT family oligopeptide transporter
MTGPMASESAVERGSDAAAAGSDPLVPYVPATVTQREWTLRAVLLGLFMSVMFNAANAYVGLKIGLTVSASIPSAVISMALLRKFLPSIARAFGIKNSPPGTILENNIVHAVASTGESLAAGIIFTVPSFYFLTAHAGPDGYPVGGILPSGWASFFYGAFGGLLGILAMIPLRQYMTIKEHANLPFPEGVACAKVLIAGDAGGVSAKPVFLGIAVGSAGKFLISGVGLVRETVFRSFAGLHKAAIGFEPTPLLLGVGYLVGARIAAVMLAGSLLGYAVMIPLIDWLGHDALTPIAPATELIRNMDAAQLRSSYIKYIGAGGVAFGGAFSIVRMLPDVGSSIRSSVHALKLAREGKITLPRTQRDIPLKWVGVGLAGVALCIMLLPSLHSPSWGIGTVALMGALAVGFSFFFVAVSARMVGIVGQTSQPVSGMTITAVLASALIIAALGYTGVDGRFAAMTIGAIVCISICLSGDMAQDLKTGALIGATPKYIQYGQMIGTIGASVRAGFILWLLHQAYHLGSSQLAAPQADLMANLVKGAMGGQLPWVLLLLGAGIGLVVELCGTSALAFSVGLYLPISTWTPLFVGGLLAWWVQRQKGSAGEKHASHERGTLFASGLVAGDALMGIGLSILAVMADQLAPSGGKPAFKLPLTDLAESYGPLNDVIPLLGFGIFAAALLWVARRMATPAAAVTLPRPTAADEGEKRRAGP